MRKMIMFLLIIALVSSTIACGIATSVLSSDLQAAWNSSSYQEWEIMDNLELAGEAFISARKGQANRLIHAAKNNNGEWKINWSTESALPQGEESITLTNRSGTTYAGIKLGTAFSYRPYRSGCYEYLYQKHNSTWLLEEIIYIDTDGTLLDTYRITDDGVTYKGWLTNDRRTFIEGRVQRDLRFFSCSGFPTDLNALKKSLSNPPEIPVGTLSAEEIKFTGGKKYSVYSGPGEDYMRSGNGKAAVSTNDWIQVFGKENSWIMIQYDITSDHMRIGWIPDNALPKNTTVKELELGDYKTYTTVQCDMTDDPLFTNTSVTTIPAGTELIWLSTMGSWTYVEWGGISQPVRGFIQTSCLAKMTEIQAKAAAIDILLATNPVAEQQPVTREMLESYSVTLDFDPMTSQWTVGFDSGRDYRYTVVVNDQTGNGWVGSENG